MLVTRTFVVPTGFFTGGLAAPRGQDGRRRRRRGHHRRVGPDGRQAAADRPGRRLPRRRHRRLPRGVEPPGREGYRRADGPHRRPPPGRRPAGRAPGRGRDQVRRVQRRLPQGAPVQLAPGPRHRRDDPVGRAVHRRFPVDQRQRPRGAGRNLPARHPGPPAELPGRPSLPVEHDGQRQFERLVLPGNGDRGQGRRRPGEHDQPAQGRRPALRPQGHDQEPRGGQGRDQRADDLPESVHRPDLQHHAGVVQQQPHLGHRPADPLQLREAGHRRHDGRDPERLRRPPHRPGNQARRDRFRGVHRLRKHDQRGRGR